MKKHKRGDVREDGKIFFGYVKGREYWTTEDQIQKERNRVIKAEDDARQTKTGHAKYILKGCKKRAKELGITFYLVFGDICSSIPDVCPVFGVELTWGKRNGKSGDFSPSLDKIIPEKGYVVGNVMWVSHLANRMKNNASQEQLKTFANWILANA